MLVDDTAEPTPRRIAGDPDASARQVAPLIGGGFSLLNLLPLEDSPRQRERLATEAIPRVWDLATRH